MIFYDCRKHGDARIRIKQVKTYGQRTAIFRIGANRRQGDDKSRMKEMLLQKIPENR